MRVAALQTDIVWEDPEANFARLEPWLRAAVEAQAHLVVLPEMYACGFSMNTKAVQEPADGPSTRFLRERAAEYGIRIAGSVPALPEDSGEKKPRPYNTLVLAGPARGLTAGPQQLDAGE